ncbi:hypothetical protein [Ferrovum myxofaciens]|nr:hypothetical protein [Ferrovum myxofaciens]
MENTKTGRFGNDKRSTVLLQTTLVGEAKVGDILGIRVYKFRMVN